MQFVKKKNIMEMVKFKVINIASLTILELRLGIPEHLEISILFTRSLSSQGPTNPARSKWKCESSLG